MKQWAHLDVQLVRGGSLANQVFHSIKDAIFTGKLQPGESIRELHLAKTLDVSQATVREALVNLERVGLVARVQNKKTVVTSFTREEVRDRLSMRIVLEELACLKAAKGMGPAEHKRLAGLAERIARAIAMDDRYESTIADMEFHGYVWQQSGSPILMQTLQQLTTPLFAFLGVMHEAGLKDLRTTRPHERLVDALKANDPRAIRREIRNHIEGSYAEFLDSGLPTLDALVNNRSDRAITVAHAEPRRQ
jgi:DNA-binding GntR family transcriptional regulator